MELAECIDAVVPLAQRHIVITTMSATGQWPADSDAPLLFHYLPSSMGQGPALGLGLALAQPARRVVVVNGDGCMLMNLGALATIGRYRPSNLAVVVLDNGIYEVTGGQTHAGTDTVDYAAVARACGIPHAYDFSDPVAWSRQAEAVLTGAGPVLVRLAVEPRFGQTTPQPRRPMSVQVQRLRAALGGAPQTRR